MSYLRHVKDINCFGCAWWRQPWLRFCYIVTLGRWPRLYRVRYECRMDPPPGTEGYGYFITFRRSGTAEAEGADRVDDGNHQGQKAE